VRVRDAMDYIVKEIAALEKDRDIWRDRAKAAKHMASLWKECAKGYRKAWLVTSSHPLEEEWNLLTNAHCHEIERAEKLEEELKELKRQNNLNICDFHDAYMKLEIEFKQLMKNAKFLAEILSPSYCRYKGKIKNQEHWEEIAQASESILEMTKGKL